MKKAYLIHDFLSIGILLLCTVCIQEGKCCKICGVSLKSSEYVDLEYKYRNYHDQYHTGTNIYCSLYFRCHSLCSKRHIFGVRYAE